MTSEARQVLARYALGPALGVSLLFLGAGVVLAWIPQSYGGWEAFAQQYHRAGRWPLAMLAGYFMSLVSLIVLGRMLFARGAAVWIANGRVNWAPLGAKSDLAEIEAAEVTANGYGMEEVRLRRTDGTSKTIPTGLLDTSAEALAERITAHLLATPASGPTAP